jgi:hypothetical protein
VRVVGALGGAGDQDLWSFAVIADDALAIGGASVGELVFGTSTSSSSTTIDVVATVGL